MYDTLEFLNICGICGSSPKAVKMLCLFSLPTTKAYVKFIGREKARAYLQCMYCKVKQWIQRELSHTIKSRCACVWIYGGYIWWLILILLCSLKIYLSFKTRKLLLENRGYLIHLSFFFFQAGIWVPIVLNISDTCPFFLISFFIVLFFNEKLLYSPMSLFCNKSFER